MSEAVINQLINDQKSMSMRAMRVVLITTFCIHVLLNIFAYINHDPILKIEMPILSGVTIIAIIIGVKIFKSH